nr:uncharacterized protein LOC117692221 [Crassostrea gigas]
MRECILFFLQIQISILRAFTVSCNASIHTITHVTTCPSTNSSFEAAAARKNCPFLAANLHRCSSFEYHCVLSDDYKYAIEVCAPSINTIGHVCTMFNSELKGISRVDGLNCTECPYSYNSTNSFQYHECYANISQTEPSISSMIKETSSTIFFSTLGVFLFALVVAGWIIVHNKYHKLLGTCFTEKQQNEEECIEMTPEVPDGIEGNPDECFSQQEQETTNADDKWEADMTTEVTTKKERDNILLKMQLDWLLEIIRNPKQTLKKNQLLKHVKDMMDKLHDRNEIGMLNQLQTEINKAKNVNKVLRKIENEIYIKFDTIERKYNAKKINISERCKNFAFQFAEFDDLNNFLNKLRKGEKNLRRDISEVILNKDLMKVFHVEPEFVSWTIPNVTVNKGSARVQKEQLRNPIVGFPADCMPTEDDCEEDVMNDKEDQRYLLARKLDTVLAILKELSSKLEIHKLIRIVKEMQNEIFKNKRKDLLDKFIGALSEDEEIYSALLKCGEEMQKIMDEFQKNCFAWKLESLKDCATNKEFDERFGIKLWLGLFFSSESYDPMYRHYNTRALSFNVATTWIKNKKEDFALFGFFYEGAELKTTCFHCGCSKDDWTEEDDILAYHSFITDSCDYFKFIRSYCNERLRLVCKLNE